MTLNTPVAALGGLAALLLAAQTQAQTAPSSGADTLDALLQCRSIEAADARLACQDEQLANVAAALDEQRLVIVEQEAVREVQRDSFGLGMASLAGFRGLFGGRSDADEDRVIAFEDGVEAETNADGDLSALRGLTVAEVREGRGGALTITFENGQVWRQTDSIGRIIVTRRHLENGLTAEIESAALGSYFMTLSNNRRRFRVQRVR